MLIHKHLIFIIPEDTAAAEPVNIASLLRQSTIPAVMMSSSRMFFLASARQATF
ncbi:hypothetical protein [Nitrosomonas cryotolerans]|uniref:hypothetical protein n=1 Tax=Nitrosomonas cryotolerans TaxID=44575 RepID=UPI000ADB8AF6|nr:hypothetical protein [Nitrosomonas cryotolerans]